MKKTINPVELIYPLPIVLVTCSDLSGKNNIITIAWTTNLSRNPVCLGITIGKGKYSISLIKETMEFGVNIPTKDLITQIDKCGYFHGNEVDKFEITKFTKKDSELILPKLIEECPINIECKVLNILDIGTSTFFIGQVLNVHVDEDILINESTIDFKKINPVMYIQKKYFGLGDFLGDRGSFVNS